MYHKTFGNMNHPNAICIMYMRLHVYINNFDSDIHQIFYVNVLCNTESPFSKQLIQLTHNSFFFQHFGRVRIKHERLPTK